MRPHVSLATYFLSDWPPVPFKFPYNGEPPKSLLVKKTVTPNELHLVRNHGGIPDIDAQAFDLQLDGLVNKPQKIALADLQNEALFPRVSKLVTIQCSGTQRQVAVPHQGHREHEPGTGPEQRVEFLPITRPTEFAYQTPEEYDVAWSKMQPRDVDD
ncbi:Oxidoreductase, molybdopterin-binding domain-containing protein [Lasiosphaeria miniovina]|uniref:Oxidoreductase, molybdopterin-binding domain-containing protein n=1 Tax=Lasiosphaeria miniovina TaxID=1954250 RepID=A0AA39ZT31_9PEZI|nr:Oxidoreductase, molybdopterin-binding domain-containing protein [Lasiosphaeria miniovina]KAK0703043.1 Oxidoreductase, molybdopterin-binding domain-containing protein [Lasiosphaeria miniovina]